MQIFKPTYNVFGFTLVGTTIPASVTAETSVYKVIKTRAEQYNWLYYRLENKFQQGIPDIILFRKNEYWFIEAKLLKRKQLLKPEDNLTWQFGQLAFMVNCLKTQSKYMLAVGSTSGLIAFYVGVYNGTEDFPDFVRQL